MNYALLRQELDTDPLDKGYSAMDDHAAAVEINVIDRTRDRATMSASEVYNAVDVGDWLALNDTQRQEIWNILHLGTLNPFGFEADRFISIFGAGSATISTLADLRVIHISRAQELGLGEVKQGDVEKARAL